MADNIVKIKFTGEGDLLKQVNKLDKATKSLINTQAKLVKNGSKTKTDAQTNAVAINKLRVRLEALGFDYNKVIISNKNFGSALMGNKVALEKLKISVNNHIIDQKKLANGTEEVSHRTRILGGTFAVLRSKMLLFNFAMGLGIRQLLKFAETSAKVDSMSRAFSTLSGNTERASVSLNKLKDATNNTMTEFDLFQQANNAMILGVADNSDTMSEMFDIAQRLGRALGRDTASSVESLITGIGRQSRLMLDNIGIIVKSEEAYEAYAEKLKTTADKLTDAQKKQAFLEATMESARAKVNSLGVEMLSSQDTLDQLSTATSELATATGDFLQPAISSMSKAFTSVAKSATVYLRTLTNARKVIGEHTSLQEQETILLARIKKQQDSLNYLRKQGALDIVTETKKTEAIMQAQIQLGVVQRKINDLAKESNEIKKEEELKTKKASEADANRSNVLKELLRGMKEAKNLAKEQEKMREQVLGGSVSFQLEQLAIFEKEYNKTVGANAESEKYFMDQRKEIILNGNKELIEMTKLLNGDERQAEIDRVMEHAQKMNELGFESIEVEAFIAREKKRINSEFNQKAIEEAKKRAMAETEAVKTILNAGKGIVKAQEDDLNQRVENELNALKKTDAYKKASTEQREIMENKVNATFASERKKLFNYNKGIAFAEATIALAEKIIQFSGNPVMQALITGLGAVQLSTISAQTPPQFETGGLVGGRRHSQGGTLIEAEQGEFVMSRSAVQAVGLEQMNEINQGNTGGVTVNVTAPLVDETVVDSIIPAIEKATRLNLA